MVVVAENLFQIEAFVKTNSIHGIPVLTAKKQ